MGAIDEAARLRAWLRLARCPGVSPRKAVEAWHEADDLERLLRAPAGRGPWPPALHGESLHRQVEREIERTRKAGWQLLDFEHPAYPARLRQLAAPPLVLSVRGRLEAFVAPTVALVGARACTTYGSSVAVTLAAGLALRGCSVVSGLARGIDGHAHRAALDAGGATIAVLGTGLGRIYPAEHRRLADEIAERGVLVTEFPPGTPPLAPHFPRRNRIIAGLSVAVVVVEAAAASGSLITARWAMDEGRDVFVVPGRVGDPLSEGPFALIRDGASLVWDVDQLIAALPVTERPTTPSGGPGSVAPADADLPPGLDPEAATVLAAIPQRDERSIDELLEKVRLSTDAVLAALFSLELGGLVEALPGQRFRRRLHGPRR
jgi:DNA processing protein